MRKLIGLISTLAVGAGLCLFALNYHIVRGQDDTVVVPKSDMTFKNTYVDIRDWSPVDFTEHADVTKALIENGHQALVSEQAGRSVIDALGDFFKDE